MKKSRARTNVIFEMMKISFDLDKKYFWILFLDSAINLANTLVVILLPSIIIVSVETNKNREKVIFMFLCLLSFQLVSELLQHSALFSNEKVNSLFQKKIFDKCFEIPYYLLEKENVQEDISQAQWSIGSFGGLSGSIRIVFSILTNLLRFLMIGGIFVYLNKISLLVVFVFVICYSYNLHLYHQSKFKTEIKKVNLERLYSYFMNFMQEYVYAKEIRIFQMGGMLVSKFGDFLEEFNQNQKTIYRRRFKHDIKNACLEILFMGVLILFLTTSDRFLENKLLVIMGVLNFSSSLSGLILSLGELEPQYKAYQIVFNFLNGYQENTKNKIQLRGDVLEIALNNVEFRYNDKMDNVINNLSITIKKGEHVAIVGENGCGKTTLVKLLLGLVIPQKGTISFNGINLNEIASTELYKKIGVVFQDFIIFEDTLENNITFKNYELDENLLSDFKYNKETYLGKRFNPNGVELSGGEKQRVMIFRAATYKDIIILDEPTSDLDPKIESDIYKLLISKYSEKTIIFISHRLTSCLYVDKVYYMKNGTISEQGRYDELMKNKRDYFEMFEMQKEFSI